MKVNKIKNFYVRYKHALLAILYCIVYLEWFAYLERTVTRGYKVIHVSLDDYIPFCEYFVVPYFLWFGYVAFVALYFFRKDKEDFRKTCIFLFTGMTIFLLISTFFPNGHHLRPRIMPRDNVFTYWVSLLYRTDTPTNLWPSIHVYNSLGAHFAIVKSRHFENRRGVRIASLILCVSIIMSTVLIKQHSLWDVGTAFIMAGVMYRMVYSTDSVMGWRRRHKQEHRPQIG